MRRLREFLRLLLWLYKQSDRLNLDDTGGVAAIEESLLSSFSLDDFLDKSTDERIMTVEMATVEHFINNVYYDRDKVVLPFRDFYITWWDCVFKVTSATLDDDTVITAHLLKRRIVL